MGDYLNPDNEGFTESRNSQIYVDKSGIIAELNAVINTKRKYVCISRPRRFGKTTAAEMISAYYCRAYDSHELFSGLKIESDLSFEKHINKYNVIMLNMADLLDEVTLEFDDSARMKKFIHLVKKSIVKEIKEEIPKAPFTKSETFSKALRITAKHAKTKFVFVIDEWDSIFREFRESSDDQRKYLKFLRKLLKDKSYVALAYMTGILPIKKYGSHSSLSMFNEYTAAEPRQYAEYLGFTLEETKAVCEKSKMPFGEISEWYNGYLAKKVGQVFNPRSVVEACLSGECLSYWTRTEIYESLREYIVLNYDGLHDSITMLLAGGRDKINIGHFSNDMTTFTKKDDVLALLVHLGYLAYDSKTEEVFIPNKEVSMEFVMAMEEGGWEEAMASLRASKECLEATLRGDSKAVAEHVEAAHLEMSQLVYNNENALACTILLAYYFAREYYTIIRELPAGNGYADMVFLPKPNHAGKPAAIIELKWDVSSSAAIDQIKTKNYPAALKNYKGKALLVGINYDKKDKKHKCEIVEIAIP